MTASSPDERSEIRDIPLECSPDRAGVRHPSRGHVVLSPGCSDLWAMLGGQNPDVASLIRATDTRVRKSNRQKQCPALLTSRRQDDGLAGRLRVEEPVGFLGLLEPPAVREEPLHVHLALGDELGALGLALLRERPRPHQRDLPAQEIRADVERDLAPLADETGGAPRAYGAHRRGTGVRRRGGVERLVRALAVRELAYRRDHVVRRGIDHLGGAELPGKLAPLAPTWLSQLPILTV